MASLPARIAATATALVLHGLFFCLSIPFLLTPLPQWRTRLLHHLNCSLPLRLNPLLCLAVSQPPRTTAPSSRIIVANQSSPIDFASIAGVFPTARFLARADQLQFPIIGWLLRAAGYIPIDFLEGNVAVRASVDRAMQACEAVLRPHGGSQGGGTIAIFPEGLIGTKPGCIGALKTGAARLSLRTHTPIVPVGIRGAARVLGPSTKGGPLINPGRIEVVVGEPLTPREGESPRELTERVRTALVHLISQEGRGLKAD